MKARKYFRVGAALVLLGAFAQVGARDRGFFSGVKVRGGFQLTSKEDQLSSMLMGFGLEGGYSFRFGRISGEAGFSYKPGGQYLHDLSLMPNPAGWIIDTERSVDSRKNQLDGLYFRTAYEKPFQLIGLRIGVQVGGTDFRQEYIADISGKRTSDGREFQDTYNGIHNKNQLSINPFAGLSISSENYFLEIQLIGLIYTALDYVHEPRREPGKGQYTLWDTTVNYKRFVPHIEFALGFRF